MHFPPRRSNKIWRSARIRVELVPNNRFRCLRGNEKSRRTLQRTSERDHTIETGNSYADNGTLNMEVFGNWSFQGLPFLHVVELQKTNLTEEDTLAIETKQTNVMSKLAEFEEITRNVQRLLGLTNVSSSTFAQMFDMLPYPHSKVAHVSVFY